MSKRLLTLFYDGLFVAFLDKENLSAKHLAFLIHDVDKDNYTGNTKIRTSQTNIIYQPDIVNINILNHSNCQKMVG